MPITAEVQRQSKAKRLERLGRQGLEELEQHYRGAAGSGAINENKVKWGAAMVRSKNEATRRSPLSKRPNNVKTREEDS